MRSDMQQALDLVRKGDDASLEKALKVLQNTVFSFSMRVCGHREDAEDTVQEVLVKSVPHLPKFENPRALLVWLYKVAKNRCLMSRRKSKFAPVQELSLDQLMPDREELEQLNAGGSINPEAYAIKSEQASRLRSAIQNLPPQYRIVLVLRDMEGLTDEEVAEITGIRPGTVRVRLHRARLFVRKELAKTQRPLHQQNARPALLAESLQRPARCKAMFAELSNYLDEKLDDSLCEELEKHLDGCGPCKAFVATLEATIEQCRKTPCEQLSPDQAAKISKHLLQQYKTAFAAVTSRS